MLNDDVRVTDMPGPQVCARAQGGGLSITILGEPTAEQAQLMVERLASWTPGVHTPASLYQSLAVGVSTDPERGEGAWGPRLYVGDASVEATELITAVVSYLAPFTVA
jgi:hypothetical protein